MNDLGGITVSPGERDASIPQFGASAKSSVSSSWSQYAHGLVQSQFTMTTV